MLKTEYENAKAKVLQLYQKANIILSDKEKETLEIADFGLDEYEKTGIACVVYVNTERCCAKEMALLPGQTCPEHQHVPVPALNYDGKEETFRCRYGTCYLYIDGASAENPVCQPPKGDEECYTVFHEIILKPGDQFTLMPNTKHWFQAGPEGAVVSEFSTMSVDEYDTFTNPNIVRIPQIED